jgi:hypothetical protein
MLKCKLKALQDPVELVEFARLVTREKVKSYLEIGSKFGGSLWHVACAMPLGSRLVAVDLVGDLDLNECIKRLKSLGYDARLLIGDSVDPKVVDAARVLGPYDLCLIDANHHEPYVRQDWANYGPMARMVAFHDIGWVQGDRPNKPWRIEVPKVWNEIKQDYRHQEIKLCPTGRDNGIGILWRS